MEIKNISIYVDNNTDIIVISSSKSNIGTTEDIDITFELKQPFSSEQLENIFYKAFEKCNSINPIENRKETVLEKFTGIKGYSNAIKNRKLITINWTIDHGYSVLPSEQKRGWFINKRGIQLGKNPEVGKLAEAFFEMLRKCK